MRAANNTDEVDRVFSQASSATRRRVATRFRFSLVAILAIIAVACVPTGFDSIDSAWDGRRVTAHGHDAFRLTAHPRFGVVSIAPSAGNRNDGPRNVFWRRAQNSSVNQESCATWAQQSSPNIQQGMALRINTADNRLRAIVLTKNVFPQPTGTFNLYVIDRDYGTGVYQSLGLTAFDTSATFQPDGAMLALPWRVCAKVQGDLFTFKAWPITESEPPYGDGVHGGSYTIPSAWTYAGAAGHYIAHVNSADGWADFITLSEATLPDGPAPALTPLAASTATNTPPPPLDG